MVRTSLRTALGAVLTTALVLSVPAVSLTQAASAADRPEQSRADASSAPARQYTRAEATEIFDRLQDALAPKDLPARRLGDPLPREDLSLLKRDAVVARSAMTPRQQSIIDNDDRPVSAGTGCESATVGGILGIGSRTWDVVESAHFCVHYTPTTNLSAANGGATLAQAQLTATTMEAVYAKEVASMGFNPPLLDSDGLYDVFLDQIGNDGYYGFCQPDTATYTSTSWCGLDNDFSANEFGAPPINSLRVTAAHEFFHAIQFAYDVGEDAWFMEGTAAWMEDQVYPGINDYLQYLYSSQLRYWRQAANYSGGLSVYGSVIFWKFLSERYKDPNIIRQVWNAARVSAGGRSSLSAVATVLKAKGSTLPAEFARYGVWNTLGNGTYADRGYFPVYRVKGCNGVKWCSWFSKTFTKSSRDTGSRSTTLNHLVTAPIVLRPSSTLPSRSKLTVSVNAPNTSRGSQARIQLRYKSGKQVTYVIVLNSLGNGSKVVAFNPNYLASAVVTLSNGSTGYNGQTFKVRGKVTY